MPLSWQEILTLNRFNTKTYPEKNMTPKIYLWILTVILICLGFISMLGFVHTEEVDAGKNTDVKSDSAIKLFDYDKLIMDKIKESSISKVASKKASYLAGLIAEHTIQANKETNDKKLLSMNNKLNKNSNNTQLHFTNN